MILSLAPMADITHFGFRRLVRLFESPHFFYSEMIHSPSLLCGGKFEKWYMLTDKYEPLIWQITSNETETVRDVVPLLLERGGVGIDLNMGCSAPHIVATGAGFAWMKKTRNEVGRWVRNARRALDDYIAQCGGRVALLDRGVLPSLSVKMRLPSIDYNELLDFVLFLIDCGVERVGLHARFQKEKYSKKPHYEYMKKLARDVSIPVFANGEIKNFGDIRRLSGEIPQLAGCIIGRQAVRKPWIFAEIKNEMRYLTRKEIEQDGVQVLNQSEYVTGNVIKKERVDLFEVAKIFLKMLETYQPTEFRLLRAKRFFSFFCDNFTFSHYIKVKVLNAKHIEEIIPILVLYFQEVPENRYYCF